MAENSKIEWTDATWNPILGCSKISPGCKHCYAIRTAWRLQHNPNPKVHEAFKGLTVIQGGEPNWTGRVNFVRERLEEPLRWKKPLNIFVNSQSDLFHEELSNEQIALVLGIIHSAKQHTFQILTKRASRLPEFFKWYSEFVGFDAWPREYPHVWLGVSAENQETADERIPFLLQTPAAVRWVSAEPLLGPLSLRWLSAFPENAPYTAQKPMGNTNHLDGLRKLDWIVVGGESGPKARPMHPDWARSLRDQCVEAEVPFFFKQWGEWAGDHFTSAGPHPAQAFEFPDGRRVFKAGKKNAGRLLDGREWSQYPRVQKVPE